jgi:hypothetical protein
MSQNIYNKSVNNTSAVNATSITTSTINSVDKIFENAQMVASNTAVTPWYPYTLDYSKGAIFYIPSDYTTSTNFQVIITNIPMDKTKVYSLTLMYYQPTNLVYCNQVRVSDTFGNYILGTNSTFSTPLFNGGAPAVTVAPNLIIQTFYICSVFTSAGVSVLQRYVATSVSNNY